MPVKLLDEREETWTLDDEELPVHIIELEMSLASSPFFHISEEDSPTGDEQRIVVPFCCDNDRDLYPGPDFPDTESFIKGSLLGTLDSYRQVGDAGHKREDYEELPDPKGIVVYMHTPDGLYYGLSVTGYQNLSVDNMWLLMPATEIFGV